MPRTERREAKRVQPLWPPPAGISVFKVIGPNEKERKTMDECLLEASSPKEAKELRRIFKHFD